MRILLLGNTGQLGWELHRCMLPLGTVHAVNYPQIDLARPEMLRPLIREVQPDLIVNAAAYTAVDRAEREPDLAHAVNAIAPGVMAEEAHRAKAALLHYSTDYVFDGEATQPYKEADAPAPINVYGRTKLEGERAIQAVGGSFLILRTSWVYGFRRVSFPVQILEWARSQHTMRIVSDQTGSPSWCRMLAQATTLALSGDNQELGHRIRERAGIYHLAGGGQASRIEWAKAVLELDPQFDQQIVESVEPAGAAEFADGAKRPAFSALDCSRFIEVFGIGMPDWRESLELAMSDIET